jgi:hypothetical protein
MLNLKHDKVRAKELVDVIAAQISCKLLHENRKALSVNKITRVLEKAFLQASAYQLEQRMGFLRRSLFANHFQWALKEQDYPRDFVVLATEGLVVAISPKPRLAPHGNPR